VRRAALLLLLLVLALTSCGGGGEESAPTTQIEPTAGVQELDNVLALRSDFEADAGKTRVILLLSPT
jgi:ABC-type glycerol-3-phosphate transport system substrate-binding protein